MDKVAERTNVLTETENKSFVHAVINAVTKGYSDNTVLEDILDLVRRKEVSKGVLLAAPDALRTYGESLNDSLQFLSDEIDQLDVIDELTVKRKELPKDDDEPNVVEEEMEKQEDDDDDFVDDDDDEKPEKKASFNLFASLEVSEDWSKYSYDKKNNIMTGHLIVNFNQDMNRFKTANKVSLSKNELDNVLTKIYAYLSYEFKNIKANLSPDIFKSEVKFSSIEKGVAEVDYEIKGAF